MTNHYFLLSNEEMNSSGYNTLQMGDVIFVQRTGYKHFGLYLSPERVIHFAPDNSKKKPYVHEAPMHEFLRGAAKCQKVILPESRAKRALTIRFIRKYITALAKEALIPPPLRLVFRHMPMFCHTPDIENCIKSWSNITVYSGKECIERARKRINMEAEEMLSSIGLRHFQDYRLADNNCETFALWCKTGTNVSLQAAYYPTMMVNGIGHLFIG